VIAITWLLKNRGNQRSISSSKSVLHESAGSLTLSRNEVVGEKLRSCA
jgi:hypothetical protein